MPRQSSTPPSWDLSALYQNSSDPAIEKDLVSSKKKARAFEKKYSQQIGKLSGDELAKAIKEYENIEAILGKLASYAYLYYSENMQDPARSQFYQKISEASNDIQESLIFFTLEINEISDSKLKKHYHSKKLQHYTPWIRDTRAFRPYQLQHEEERILHKKYLTSRQAWHRLFEESLAGLHFPFKGKQLSCTEILHYFSDKNEKKRKLASDSFGKVLGENISLFTHITNTLAKDKEIDDQLRGLPQPISSRNISNLLEDDITETLLSTVKANYEPLAHRYYQIKAKMLGKKKLETHDRNAPLPGQKDKQISWEEAKQIVLESYHSFSPAMGKIAERAFKERWIDAKISKGKDSGAYSHPTVPSAHPYILMNFQGKLRDVMTLAHEMGHTIHQVFSAKQGVLMSDTPLTLAETASVFGEQLTFRRLLASEKNETQRKLMIASKVEDMLNTVVRQVAFCEFEKTIHDRRRHGELSSEEIGVIWLEKQQESLGPIFNFSKNYRHFWAYIPHFIHTPFYVYAYAFGDCLVNSLYQVYMEKPEGFVDKYLEMLSAGGTLRHKELLAPFGLYAGDKDFWQKGLGMISGFIDELD